MAKLHTLCGKAGVQGGATARAAVCRLWCGNAPPFFVFSCKKKVNAVALEDLRRFNFIVIVKTKLRRVGQWLSRQFWELAVGGSNPPSPKK